MYYNYEFLKYKVWKAESSNQNFKKQNFEITKKIRILNTKLKNPKKKNLQNLKNGIFETSFLNSDIC